MFILSCFLSVSQTLIHAHNDYQKPEPLTHSLRYKIFSIEADIYLSEGKLLVAHDKNELSRAKTLDAMYLQPLSQLYSYYHGTVSGDSAYAPILLIDIKENGEAVIAELIKRLASHRSVFDRSVNPKAIQIVISGDRGAASKWTSYPPYLFFDGRPYEVYDNATLERVAFISDSYSKYWRSEDTACLQVRQLAQKVHHMNKLLRLWAIPDNADWWNRLHRLGVDIINTDKVAGCSTYFSSAVLRQ
jgi:alkaline phosphatase